METIQPGEALAKIVPADTSPSAYSPFWTKEAELDAAVKAGRNLSDHFGLPVVSEASRYDVYRITPKVPTQVFVNTVAPTSELGGAVAKTGGANQSLVPNRQLFNEPVHVRSVDNTLNLAAEVERPGMSPGLVRGVGTLGAAAVVYDATTTTAHATELLNEGNRTGAQSQVEHFAGRTVGGLAGGFGAGFAYGALAGSETGPGAFATGLVGGAIGALGGEKLMDWHDQNKIYNQADPHGQTWHYNREQPQQGWTRDLPPLPETPHGQQLRADPALAERLTYQASTTAADLAMGRVGRPADPYTQPATAKDTPSFGDPPWQRSAQTGQWERQINAPFVERQATPEPRMEIAPLERAKELDAFAQATIAQNLATSKHGIAEQYQAAYQQHHWQQFGPMPEAVSKALNTPATTLEASNGHTYTRGADGQWTTPGMLYGTNAAEGNVRHELDATQRAAQGHTPSVPEAQHISMASPPAQASPAPSKPEVEPTQAATVRQPSQAYLDLSAKLSRISQAMETDDWFAVRKDIEAYNNTPAGRAVAEQAKAAVDREQQQAIPSRPRDPGDPGHPDHALNENIRDQLVSLHAKAGIYPSSALIDPLTAAVALNARENRMAQVDQLQFNPDKSTIIAMQGARGFNDLLTSHSFTAVQPALQTPPEQSYQQMASVTAIQQHAQIEQERQQQIAQFQAPSMGR